ncbi:MAG: alpha/beta hydrolase [Epsilonproteobacteria bacterium]|nr:MAG: alpha/beta hydrolase [Campylobacterota bacterium]
MKKVLLSSMILLMTIASQGYAKQSSQFGGRVAPDSPTVFKAGKNKVWFYSEGTKVVGNLYVPSNYKKGRKYTAIVVVGPKGAVKEQTAGIYAKKLSKKGFVTLVIDHRTYGESGGEPRHYENPYMKIEDVKNATSYIGSLNIVNKNKIAMLGVCNGGGFGAAAAIYDGRVKAYASVSGLFDLRSQIVNGKAGDKANLLKIMKQSTKARQKYFETGKVEYIKQMPNVDKNSNQLRKEAYEYYCTSRGLCPNYGENKMAVMSRDTRRSFEITNQLSLLSPRPYLAIAGTKALTLGLSKAAVKRANEPKELFLIEGATHVALYDIDKYVNQAINKLDKFYKKLKDTSNSKK